MKDEGTVIVMRVGIYARVSTQDKDQNPETQLLPLREFCHAQSWDVAGEFVDQASATDLRGRREWRRLLDLASKRRVDVILVWKLDRMARSVKDAADTLAQLRAWKVGLRSYTEPMIDTSSTSPWGELLYNLLAAFSQFERSIIAERVKAGMARADARWAGCAHPRNPCASPPGSRHRARALGGLARQMGDPAVPGRPQGPRYARRDGGTLRARLVDH
jgi:hypothetical protein